MLGIADDIVLDADHPWWEDLDYQNLINWESPLNQGLVSDWLVLPQGFGGPLLFDLAGKHHGTLAGGAEWSGSLGRPGGFGSINMADITGAKVTVPDHPDLDLLTDFTLTAWIRLPSGIANQKIWTKGSGGAEWDSTNATDLRFNRDEQAVILSVSISAHPDSWRFYALTVKPGENAMYRDGVLLGSNATAPNLVATAVDLHLGADANDTAMVLGDRWDSIRAYNRALSASEIAALYLEESRGYPTTLNRIRKPAPSIFIFPAAGGAAAEFDAALTSTASLTAALTTEITLASAVSATAGLSAVLTTEITVAAALSAAASLAGQLTTEITVSAALAASASLSGELTTEITLAAGLGGSAALSGELTVGIGLEAALSAAATVSAELTTEITLLAGITARAILSADLTAGPEGASGPMYSVARELYEHGSRERQLYEHRSINWQLYEHGSVARELTE